MKKIPLLLAILFFFSFNVNAQNVYYDASWLREKIFENVFDIEKSPNREQDSLRRIFDSLREKRISDTAVINPVTRQLNIVLGKKDDSLFSLLKKYFPGITETSTSAQITAIIQKNPFFKTFSVQGATKGGGNPFKNVGFSSIIQSASGLDVTKYANAIADIMIERAKQELTVAFFNRFKKFSEENPEFKILFPKTTDNLRNLLTYSYPQMLPALRTAFFEDLKQVTYHLDDVLELPRYRHLLNNFPEVRVAIKSIRLMHDIEDGTSTIADVIKGFAEFKEWDEEGKDEFKNLGSAVKFAALFSEGLRSKDTSQIWIPVKEAKTQIRDEIFVRLFMGLLYQQIKNNDIKFYFDKKSRLLADIIGEQSDNILLFQNKLSEFISLSDKVYDTYGEIKTKLDSDSKVSNEDIYNYINLSIDIADYSFSIVKIFNEDLVTDKYLVIVKQSNALFKDVYSEQYTKAVNDAVDILKTVHDWTKKNTKAENIAKPNFAEEKAPALSKILDFIEKVKPYALFMANMVEADTEAEVKAALENVILPVGSSSIKKHTKGNLSVQTYLGAFLTASGPNNNLEGTWSDKFGVTAPIGVSWTPGFLSWEKYGALSIYAALFDIGAIVDYKLQTEPNPSNPNTTVVTKDYKIELGQIFSPGVHIVYGVGANIPLSLGFGAQYGPGLSKIELNNNTVLKNPSWRWNFFLAVDLPFFNLANRPKRQ